MSSIIDTIKGWFSKGESPVDESMQAKIQEIIAEEIKGFKEAYDEHYQAIVKEKNEKEEPVVHEEVDKAAKEGAGVDNLKEKISNAVSEGIQPEVDQKLPENEMAKKAGQKAVDKTVEKSVDKSVDKILDKLAKEEPKEA